jgi:hypothetical protein
MRKAKFLKFKTRILTPMPKTETSRSAIEAMIIDNNGKLYMLMSTLSQRKVNSTHNLDCMLKEISILCHHFQAIDILISLTTETWSSRLRMEERLKSGTSINNPRPSEPDTTINHGTSRALEEQTTCKSGQPIQDGSKCSSMKITNSSIQPTTKLFQLMEPRILKDRELSLTETKRELIKDGKLSILTKPNQSGPKDSIKSLDSISTGLSILDQDSQ